MIYHCKGRNMYHIYLHLLCCCDQQGVHYITVNVLLGIEVKKRKQGILLKRRHNCERPRLPRQTIFISFSYSSPRESSIIANGDAISSCCYYIPRVLLIKDLHDTSYWKSNLRTTELEIFPKLQRRWYGWKLLILKINLESWLLC